MYPQSLQTHSPCQYLDSASNSAALFAFLLPKTFKAVEEEAPETDGTTDTGATEKASVEERHSRAKMKEVKKDFMFNRRCIW